MSDPFQLRLPSHKDFCNHFGGSPGERHHFAFLSFRDQSHACPYLPGKVERKVFTELNGRNAGELNEALGRIGFAARNRSPIARRASTAPPASRCASSPTSSRPARPSASSSAAMPTSRSARASRGRPKSNMRCCANISLRATRAAAWRKWTNRTSPTWSNRPRCGTFVIEYREPSVDGRPGKLVGACLSDQQADGMSMIYSFYDVGEDARRGLAPTSSSTTSSAPRAPACRSSISAIGSRGRTAWPIKPASSRWNALAATAGALWTRPSRPHSPSGAAADAHPRRILVDA